MCPVAHQLRYQYRIGQYRIDPVSNTRGKRVNVVSRRRFRKGHDQDFSVELQRNCLEFAANVLGHDRGGIRAFRNSSQIDRRQLGQMGQSTDHHARNGKVPANQQFGESLAVGPRLGQQRCEIGLRLVAALYQCLGKTRRPFHMGICVDRAHATTRRTSSRVVSPSMAFRKPLWRKVTIP